ncbi:MAG: Uma2 family endonuclease [Bacteroidia bacterium]|nr:Uma2 family endonuclease [Bacteroidia bacterium]
MNAQLLEPILQSVELPKLIRELQKRWEDEQARRHEFWENISDDVKAEFIQGEIIYHSPVKRRHLRASRKILNQLINHTDGKNMGEVGYEKTMIRLTRNDYEPDICFWAHEKVQLFDDDQSIFPVPNFIVEVLSPSTEDRDRGVKFQDYALHGVSEYWIVDPKNKFIEQYILENDQYTLVFKSQKSQVESRAVPGFQMLVEDIFKN